MRRLDLTGKVFTRWKVKAIAGKKKRRLYWKCVCTCGTIKDVMSSSLVAGTSKSCGCLKIHNRFTHGQSHRKQYFMWWAAKKRASEAQIPFSIGISDIPDIPDKCPILGIPLVASGKGRVMAGSPSLDKIVPSKGYVLGNIQIISSKANRMKNDATTEEIGKLYNYMVSLELGKCQVI